MRAARGGIDVASAHRCRVGEGERADRPTDICDFDRVTNTDRPNDALPGWVRAAARGRPARAIQPGTVPTTHATPHRSTRARGADTSAACGWYRHQLAPGHAARSARRGAGAAAAAAERSAESAAHPAGGAQPVPASPGRERARGRGCARTHASCARPGVARAWRHTPLLRGPPRSPRGVGRARSGFSPAAGPPSERMRAPRPRGRDTARRASRRRLSSSARKSQRIRAKPTKTARKDSKPQTHPRRARGGKTKQNKNIVRKGAPEPHPCARSARRPNEGSHVKLQWYTRGPEP